MKKHVIFPIISFLFLILITACSINEQVIEVPISQEVNMSNLENKQMNDENTLKFLILSTVSIKKTYQTYYDLISLVEEKLGLPVQIIQKKTYSEALEAFEKGEVDIGYVCGYLSVLGNERGIMDKLAMPIVEGKDQYTSYLITRKDLDIDSITDFEGRSFAFSDPSSFSGYLVPKHIIEQEGFNFDTFFSKSFFTYSHNHSIAAVANGLADATAVYSTSYEKLQRENNPVIADTKVIARGPMVGNHPIVVNPKMDNELKEKMKTIFLTLHESQKGKEILEQLNFNFFVGINEELYTPILAMIEELEIQYE